ncbi:hypothetical protein ACN28G_14895 [Micromonospora sp. WMMA1923]|uniref:hypothetical protein n=1 Tax=Micromonospora sp. WMMA1923 TaxID=3404125 RepID=UPI003B935097
MTTMNEKGTSALRAAMVSELRGDTISSAAVAAAFSVVPRHLFAPARAFSGKTHLPDSVFRSPTLCGIQFFKE